MQVRVDDGLPLFERQVFYRDWWCTDAGVVEQQVEAAEALLRVREQCAHRVRILDIGWNGYATRDRGARALDRGIEKIGASPGKNDAVPILDEGERDRFADPGARPGDNCNLGGSAALGISKG